jgi:ABC-type phosphate/phosphonate transport system ATPase subunit
MQRVQVRQQIEKEEQQQQAKQTRELLLGQADLRQTTWWVASGQVNLQAEFGFADLLLKARRRSRLRCGLGVQGEGLVKKCDILCAIFCRRRESATWATTLTHISHLLLRSASLILDSTALQQEARTHNLCGGIPFFFLS